jgi:hypothetical protein
MTVRKPRKPAAAKAVEPTREDKYKIPQEELENFFTDPEPSEKPLVQKKKSRPPKTGKIFLGQEDIRHFEAYKKFLKEEQGITDVRHKRI